MTKGQQWDHPLGLTIRKVVQNYYVSLKDSYSAVLIVFFSSIIPLGTNMSRKKETSLAASAVKREEALC